MNVIPKLPSIIWHKNRLFPLSEDWLTETIERSASVAGYKRWDLAPQVARAIAIFLETDCMALALSADSLREMIRRSLDGIGYEDIGKVAMIVPPRLTLSLGEIAERQKSPKDPKSQVEFYAVLKDRLTEALAVQLGGICLEDLRPCCRILAGTKRWNRACEVIHDELLTFCRNYLARTSKGDVEMIIR